MMKEKIKASRKPPSTNLYQRLVCMHYRRLLPMINFILVEDGGICFNQESYTNATQILTSNVKDIQLHGKFK